MHPNGLKFVSLNYQDTDILSKSTKTYYHRVPFLLLLLVQHYFLEESYKISYKHILYKNW